MLKGCITAVVTPMFDDGSVDYARLSEFVEWQIKSGVDGLVAVGSTGEAATLTDAEKILVIKQIIATNAGRVKIIVGSGTASTAATLNFVQQVNQLAGVDYLMCLTPYYVKPTQEGLFQHFSAVSECSKFPVILYNVPGRTAADIHDATILRLAHECKKIIGLKDATGDIKRCTYLLAHKPADFLLFSGDDASSLAFMLAGGNGVISVVSNIRPALFSQMCALALAHQSSQARAINDQLLGLYELLFVEANPIPVKWGLFFEQRLGSAHLRLPLTVLSQKYQESLKNVLIDLK
ncbi:MAG: 4-hydroxy-tetrahydrodipicolinate synthase [Burkholderiales bacterium]|nr:4-hydroxy-tetrahydrodipicolinate synthase [Burkholderiales bacterium]